MKLEIGETLTFTCERAPLLGFLSRYWKEQCDTDLEETLETAANEWIEKQLEDPEFQAYLEAHAEELAQINADFKEHRRELHEALQVPQAPQ